LKAEVAAAPLQLSMMTFNPPTAALLLSEFVSLKPGEWVIQNAANSAVGLYLVQLARCRGYRSVNVVPRADAAEAGPLSPRTSNPSTQRPSRSSAHRHPFTDPSTLPRRKRRRSPATRVVWARREVGDQWAA
jgi:hypothetical protein